MIRRRTAFSLVEMLVAMAVLTVVLMMLFSIVNAVSRTLTLTNGLNDQMRSTQDAFDEITRRLSQATLNTYYDYDNPAEPTRYIRQSELRFLCGSATDFLGPTPSHPTHAVFFVAPLGYSGNNANKGLTTLLNTWGFYIEYGDNTKWLPPFLQPILPPGSIRSRFRLLELMQPAESMALYKYTSGSNNTGYTGHEWFTEPLQSASFTHVLAENVIALIFLPRLSSKDIDSTGKTFAASALAPNYLYDSSSLGAATGGGADAGALNSKNQLPPLVQVTMVSVDETSMLHLPSPETTINEILKNLFQLPSKYDADLAALEKGLADKHISFHTFTTTVGIQASKWSRAETN